MSNDEIHNHIPVVNNDIFNPKNQLPEPDTLLYFQNLSDRTLWLTDEVDNWQYVSIYIVRWNSEDASLPTVDRKPIKLFINSNGGDMFVCTGLIDVIKASRTPVWGICSGVAYSAAAFVLMCCHRRFVTKRSSLMIHRGSGEIAGNQADARAFAKEWDRMIGMMHDTVLDETRVDEKTLDDQWDRDWYLCADEAISFGFADEMLTDLSTII